MVGESLIFRQSRQKHHFWPYELILRLKTTPDFFDEKSKIGLGFEIGQPQHKCQRRPTLQSMANPAVCKQTNNLWYLAEYFSLAVVAD